MVKMVRDLMGRFAQRPYYLAEELDRECEQVVTAFLSARRDEVCFPITTDELSVLIETEGADLDSCVDLSRYGDDVEGVTAFYADREPDVMISDRLANDLRRENRLRTTLAHEFGHVRFHRHLWAEKLATGDLFAVQSENDNKAICKRDTILNARQSDWMEWQAGYISGAILMPVSAVRKLADEYCMPQGIHGAVELNSDHGQILVHSVKDEFQVSEEAARVRLQALHLLSGTTQQSTLSF
ncbi:ImmA/IrrE family metallo-endopeptidase [Falsochrobactrum sp. TDYN1]|uniref:ImmA/IrrE family metallo-endopeptidase n=1 Tax=Falsochrobactrum tianjinense TaxID=2706015 RepID=A0A949PPE5_9HYPH|nr:ImmA/IrrE family metallo-endopeptidase [Falsochrobactrum sp. TDYN1]MBV2144848.1 ImmA/IrrE family metallo-endopeptidase [Falsochrobactrum sp. TDYN1]